MGISERFLGRVSGGHLATVFENMSAVDVLEGRSI